MELDTDDPELMDTSSGDDNTPPVRAEEDEVEERRIDEFISKTCECHYGPNKVGCSVLFPRELIAATCMNCLEMTKPELDLVVIANLEANRRATDVEGVPRVHIDYRFHGHKVCKATFLLVHAVGTKQFKPLVTHFSQNGLIPRRQGNAKRLPSNTLPFSDTQDIVEFIRNFATVHALPLPGRMPGIYSKEKALLLPSEMSKRYVYRQYCEACTESPVCRRKFEMLWCELLPHISAMKPATELCEVRHLNIVKITCTSNLPDSSFEASKGGKRALQ